MVHSIQINGIHVRYLQKGQGDPFVLLHGFSFNGDTWAEMGLFDELAGRYNVFSFDMPYGPKSRSDKFEVKSRDEYADFLGQLLKGLDIDQPLVLGASISGEVTLRYLSKGHSAKAAILAGPVGIQGLVPRLARIAVPLLAVWGERDNISSPDNGQILSGQVRDARVHIIPDAGHACYLDKPGEFKALVRDFLS